MMWRHLVVGCFVYGALVVQPSVSVNSGNPLLCPWIPGIALIVCGLWLDGSSSLIWSAVLGLGVDCLSGERLGFHVVGATIASVCMQLIRGRSSARGVLSIGPVAFIAITVWRVVSTVLRDVVEHAAVTSQDLARILSECSATTVLFVGTILTLRILANELGLVRDSTAPLSNRWSMLTES